MDLPVAIPHRIETIRAHKARGGRVAAVLPIHYPRALLRAFDILPVEVWGPPPVDATRGSAHLQPYVCSIVRNALATPASDTPSPDIEIQLTVTLSDLIAALTDVELAERRVPQSLEQLGRQVERGPPALRRISYAAHLLITSATLWPPKPIEFDRQCWTCRRRGTFGT